MIKMKPCPLCGGKSNIRNNKNFGFQPGCNSCHLFISRYFKTEESAVKAWNTRTPLTEETPTKTK